MVISVILPLAIDWEPWYRTSDELSPGDRVDVSFSGRKYCAVVSAVLAAGVVPDGMDPDKIRPAGARSPLPPVSREELALWRFVADYYLCPIGEVYRTACPPGALREELKGLSLMEARRRRDDEKEAARAARIAYLSERIATRREQLAAVREGTKMEEKLRRSLASLEDRLSALKEVSPSVPPDLQQASATDLTAAQQASLADIRAAFANDKTVLLRGVTGSGKTEIYMALAAETMSGGKNVLYLVPEIALSRQLEDRLAAVFGPRLLVFHSAVTPAQRRMVTSAVRGGGGYIVLGTRSAVFLPHRELGLVIVDEEHDGSYKQSSPAPRYNGRDCAPVLGGLHGAHVLLGSATPSLESIYNCKSGRYVQVSLDERYYVGEASDIELVDTSAERRKRGMHGSFSLKLIEHVRRTLECGGQVAMLRPRRSYAPSVQCTGCGTILRCPRCNVPLSWHKDRGLLICHSCGLSRPFTACPSCGGELQPVGAGTQRIEEEAAGLFPGARIVRLDGDTARGREEAAIHEFADGGADILIGTQIVAKGFDFERLMLVAVIGADSLLGLQDFRADERALQLLSQFRGRAGRRGKKGLLVIQTAASSHPVFAALMQGRDISAALLAERKAFGYPPFMRLVDIVMKSASPAPLESEASALAARLHDALKDRRAVITGPYAPSRDKVADRYVLMIRVSLPKDASLAENKRALLEAVRACKNVQVSIDVDPF